MAAIAASLAKIMLDWSLAGGSAPTRPPGQAVGLSTAAPTSVSGSEIAPGSGYTRQTATFASAVSPAGSASNSNSMSFGPYSTGCTVSGVHIWDSISATVGNMLYYGTLATPRTLGVGDSLIFNAGSLIVTLA